VHWASLKWYLAPPVQLTPQKKSQQESAAISPQCHDFLRENMRQMLWECLEQDWNMSVFQVRTEFWNVSLSDYRASSSSK
jgi:hypothetical protein